jgi:transposase
MTWHPHPLLPVPEATAAAVRAAFPKGNLYVELRTAFGTLYDDPLFADLYADHGGPVDVAPWRLALVTVMQYIEGLTDRQAADAVRRCMDWKYALVIAWLWGEPSGERRRPPGHFARLAPQPLSRQTGLC